MVARERKRGRYRAKWRSSLELQNVELVRWKGREVTFVGDGAKRAGWMVRVDGGRKEFGDGGGGGVVVGTGNREGGKVILRRASW